MRLAIGTAQFGQKYGIANTSSNSYIDVHGILDFCRHHGINTIDTAQAYGNSEVLLGEQGVSGFDVITKIFIPDDIKISDDVIYQLFEKSQDNLRINKVHGLLIHNPRVFLDPCGPDLFRALRSLKNKGLIDLFGVSVYSTDEAEYYLSNYHFDLYQIPLSVVDRRFYKNNLIKRIKNRGSQIYARSIFLQGLLVNESLERPSYFNQWSDFFKKYYEIVVESGLTPMQFCLASVLSDKDISKVVVGVDSLPQLREIVESYSEDFTCSIEKIGEPDLGLIDPRLWR